MNARLLTAFALLCLAPALAPAAEAQSNGAFSPYLVGSFEQRYGIGTALQIINPTLEFFKVTIAFFDAGGTCKGYLVKGVNPNAVAEVLVPTLELRETFGVVKIISWLPEGRSRAIRPGISGFRRHCTWGVGCTESNLAGVPETFAPEELEKIYAECALLPAP